MPKPSKIRGAGGPARIAAVSLAALFLALSGPAACENQEAPPSPAKLAPITAGPEEVAPETLERVAAKPPHIKLRRNKDGTHSWEVSGDDADAVLAAERKISEGMNAAGRGK